MKTITITWKAFGNKPENGRFISSVQFDFYGFLGQEAGSIADENICEAIYRDTNTYGGLFWNIIEPKLSPTRTHTAMSVGDEIEIDGRLYVCVEVGFTAIEKASA